MYKNTTQGYGRIAKLFHWLSAVVIFALFGLGFWMVDLTYYSEWYKTAPHWHKSIGILLLIATVLRLVWRKINITPDAIETHSVAVRKSAHIAHVLLYGLLLVLMCSGYLISTADGRAISVFNWFDVPALGKLFSNQEDISGIVHEYAAYILISTAVLHALAAIKHHVIDKDATLTRMFK
ncbi:cytochrome b [Thalassomonas viridans]|uniref:Cytochrome b n=1 Tax=Thalassomonas viridans TaxID=137584 RepID=A0AAF0C8A7_9GAMM|nr:cytochrome b [Thalassomonas viridans]WDE04171.1 cytochrome b [Thalassomonas viridans]